VDKAPGLPVVQAADKAAAEETPAKPVAAPLEKKGTNSGNSHHDIPATLDDAVKPAGTPPQKLI
jgi:hypothetical protein